MNIKFEKKFSEVQIDSFIQRIFNNYKKNPTDSYHFDLTETEWISNQGLLLFTGILKYFLEKKVHFEILFIKKGMSTRYVPKRVALQIIQIWEIWGIWKIIPDFEYEKYLGITESTIRSLKEKYKINFVRPEIYDRFEITPFVCLEYIKNYNDTILIERLKKYHALNEATIKIVEENNCEHPFINDLFGEIISREVYENFLVHSESSFFNSSKKFAFFSLVLKGKIDEEYNDEKFIQEKLELNFKSEEITESKDFFYDKERKKYKNQSYISYSFVDFGQGIVNSLRDEFEKNNKTPVQNIDAEIIKYAFKHDTSRYPIKNVFNNIEIKDFIPRGLFDVLSLVQRYNGLLIVRSCNGKVLYDFSNTSDIQKAFSTFGKQNIYFPGTFITINLPAITKDRIIDKSVIKPVYQLPIYTHSKVRYQSLYKIITKVKQKGKEDSYSNLFDKLYNIFKNNKNNLTYFSLENITDKQLIKKTIFFFVANYEININNNIIIFHPPKKEILDEINFEILSLSNVTLNYKIHPLPFIYYLPEDVIELYWLGIYDEHDKNKLNDLLYKQFSLARSDFNDPDSIIGHLNYFDKFNNLETKFPDRGEIIKFYKKGELFSRLSEIESLIKNKCISRQNDCIFLCSGNYYQHEYLELIKLLNSEKNCSFLSATLFDVLEEYLDQQKIENRLYKYIAFTSSSHRILNCLNEKRLIEESDLILIDNYHDLSKLQKELPKKIEKYEYVLICDAISTGYLVTRVEQVLKIKSLSFIGVIADTIDTKFSLSEKFYSEHEKKIISLIKYPIKKYLRTDVEIRSFLTNKNVIRINPYTNIPITLSINETNPIKIILSKDELFELIDNRYVNIGFQKINNIIHPYFFDTKNIIKNVGISFLNQIFNKKNDDDEYILNIETNNLRIFYPKDSDIQHLDFELLKSDVLKDHSVEVYKLERYNTEDGWKFPHTTEYLSEIVNHNPVLILDDGACSGDSLTQMINEMSFYNPKKITVLSLIGRLLEHKREFLSIINQVKKNKRKLDVEIFFGTHWHIPTYPLHENPNTSERSRLNKILSIVNTPSRIKNFAASINKALLPREKENFENHKYLPKIKGSNTSPNMDIINVRDEVGKVIGFRFYTENFDWFNSFIKRYESSQKSSDRYKDVELLCATVSFEPYIFERLIKILPDITEKLREFIDTIIFGNPQKGHKQLNIKDLFFSWDPRDIIHLLFIIYPNNELIKKLNKNDNVSRLILFLNKNKVAIDYLFYKILNFFPLNIEELDIKNPIKMLALLKTLSHNENMNEDNLRQLNIFKAFISTLPSKEDYSNQLFKISDTLDNLLKDEFHKTSLRAQLGYMLSDIETMNMNFNAIDTKQFNENWINISKFLAQILSFVQLYPNYLPVKLANQAQSLSIIYGRLNEQIPNLTRNSKLNEIESQLEQLRKTMFNKESEIFKLFLNPITYNIVSNIDSKLEEFELRDKCNIQSSIHVESKLVFPEYYFKEIILESLLNNLRHRDKTKDPVTIKIKDSSDNQYIIFEIENKIDEESKPGSGYGSILMDFANNFPRGDFQYKSNKRDNFFFQKILIKKF